jgi:predicted dehydrogenase
MAIGLGVIGTGKHGSRYLAHAADVPALRRVALTRRDREAGARQARECGCRFHGDPETLIADPDVEAVVLVVPPSLNVRLAELAARAGKALLIEKPLARTLAECRAIFEATSRAGVPVMVAHTLRFNAVVQAVRAALPSLGPLHAVALTQRFEPTSLVWLDRREESGGGIVMHTAVHGFDLLRYLTGREARRVTATATRVVTRDTEDNFAATIEMDDGLRASVAGSRATAGRSGSIEVAGRDAQIAGDHVHGFAARLVGATRTPLAVGEPVMTVRATLAEFAAALVASRTPAITLADGAKSVAIAEACYRAIDRGSVATVEAW